MGRRKEGIFITDQGFWGCPQQQGLWGVAQKQCQYDFFKRSGRTNAARPRLKGRRNRRFENGKLRTGEICQHLQVRACSNDIESNEVLGKAEKTIANDQKLRIIKVPTKKIERKHEFQL